MAQEAPMSMTKIVLIVLGVAMAAALAVIAVQMLLTGTSNGAVAGGVAGGTAAVVGMQLHRKRQAASQQQPKV